MIYRGGVGDESAARLSIDEVGKVLLVSGLIDVGEGAVTVLCQMAAEALSVPYEDVIPRFADTEDTPDAPITAGSTATFSTGTAVLRAAERLRQRMLEVAAGRLEADAAALSIADGAVLVTDDPSRRITYAALAQAVGADTLTAEATVMPGSPDYIVNSFGAHFCEVEVDTATGRVRVTRYVAAHDSGRIINPRTALNQVEGAISQMLGFALSEELITDTPTGVTLNGSYLEHKSPTIQDYPDITAIFADVVDPVGPMGAKGLGEVPSVGVAPAIANALYDAIGVRFWTRWRRCATSGTPSPRISCLGESFQLYRATPPQSQRGYRHQLLSHWIHRKFEKFEGCRSQEKLVIRPENYRTDVGAFADANCCYAIIAHLGFAVGIPARV